VGDPISTSLGNAVRQFETLVQNNVAHIVIVGVIIVGLLMASSAAVRSMMIDAWGIIATVLIGLGLIFFGPDLVRWALGG
jgi:sensor histidine kinase regulating citrate/malate metabolism